MKSNNLRIIFSALILMITWQSDALAQRTGVPNPKAPGSSTFVPNAGTPSVQNENLPRAVDPNAAKIIDRLNSDTLTCPPVNSGNVRQFEINTELASEIAATSAELAGVTNSMMAYAQAANLALDTFGFTQTDSLSFQGFLRQMPAEAQQSAQNLQVRYLKRLKELHQDQDGNGFMDWIDELKKRGDLSQETLENLIWEDVFSKEEAASLGISEAEFEEFNKNCRSRISGV